MRGLVRCQSMFCSLWKPGTQCLRSKIRDECKLLAGGREEAGPFDWVLCEHVLDAS